LWFNYTTGPNGVSIRILYTAIMDLGDREYIERIKPLFEREGLETKILCGDNIQDIYEIARLDPDLIDVIYGSKLCVIVISARTKAMGSK